MTSKKTEEKKASMDLSALDSVSCAEVGSSLEILHPATKEPTGIIIRLLGADSKVYREKQLALMRKRFRGGKSSQHLSLNAAEADAIGVIAACTVGWENLEEHGELVPFSEAKARDIYTRYPAIREQVSAFIEDRANFLPPLKED